MTVLNGIAFMLIGFLFAIMGVQAVQNRGYRWRDSQSRFLRFFYRHPRVHELLVIAIYFPATAGLLIVGSSNILGSEYPSWVHTAIAIPSAIICWVAMPQPCEHHEVTASNAV